MLFYFLKSSKFGFDVLVLVTWQHCWTKTPVHYLLRVSIGRGGEGVKREHVFAQTPEQWNASAFNDLSGGNGLAQSFE